jgi:serine phosphatase RsbU (regulator of sigma subunit)
MFTIWFGGVGPGYVNLLLAPIALTFFVLHPRFSFSIESPVEQFGLLLYCVTAVLLLVFNRSGHLIRGVIRSSIEQSPLGEIPSRVDDLQARLAAHIAHAEFAERQLAAEFRVAQILTGSGSIAAAARPVLQVVCEALGWEVGLFWIVEGHARDLRLAESWGQRTSTADEFQRESSRYTFSSGDEFPGRVSAAQAVVWVPNITQELDYPRWKLATKVGLAQAIGFPVRNGAESLGVMEFTSRQIGQPDERPVEVMTCIANQISQFIERTRAQETVREHDHDRRLARQIQEGLLPAAMPSVAGFQIGARALFAKEVGGDYFDFLPLGHEGEDCLGIVIGDATGHGIAAALCLAEARAYIHALALTSDQPGAILACANSRLAEKTKGDHLVTLLLVRLDPRKKVLRYAGAGHRSGYVLDQDGHVKALLASTGLPLGADLLSEYPESPEVALKIGDLIVLFTDGIVERHSPAGELFGSERLLATVHHHREHSPDQILDALFQAATDHAQGELQLDDATAVIIKVEPPPGEEPPISASAGR